jgi:hypothetical protein
MKQLSEILAEADSSPLSLELKQHTVFGGGQTWANLDEAVVLDEDGVAGQVAMDNGRFAGVKVAADGER